MDFSIIKASKEDRYCLGIEKNSGKYFLAIRVSLGVVDYFEFYELSDHEYKELDLNPVKAKQFGERCRNHEEDSRLMLKPGQVRGVPV